MAFHKNRRRMVEEVQRGHVQERKEKLVSGALNTASKEEKQAQRLDDLKILFQGALSEKVGRKN